MDEMFGRNDCLDVSIEQLCERELAWAVARVRSLGHDCPPNGDSWGYVPTVLRTVPVGGGCRFLDGEDGVELGAGSCAQGVAVRIGGVDGVIGCDDSGEGARVSLDYGCNEYQFCPIDEDTR